MSLCSPHWPEIGSVDCKLTQIHLPLSSGIKVVHRHAWLKRDVVILRHFEHLAVCVYVHEGTYGGQKKVMELELQVVVSHHLGVENESGSSVREVSTLNY